MSEFEVITALGPPSSVRDADGSRVLLYALEIGGGAFLGGSVTLRERAVGQAAQFTWTRAAAEMEAVFSTALGAR